MTNLKKTKSGGVTSPRLGMGNHCLHFEGFPKRARKIEKVQTWRPTLAAGRVDSSGSEDEPQIFSDGHPKFKQA